MEKQPIKGQVIVKASLATVWSMNFPTERTSTTATLEFEGKAKDRKIEVSHTYCPFCGEKYENRKEAQGE
ncbi:hypothetical protein [Roseivirga seohaensis]|uniref:hypothetical protein n=1 Tax=Roseivirga seohaensis TaxID=1914963 RepID=UPI003BA97554